MYHVFMCANKKARLMRKDKIRTWFIQEQSRDITWVYVCEHYKFIMIN